MRILKIASDISLELYLQIRKILNRNNEEIVIQFTIPMGLYDLLMDKQIYTCKMTFCNLSPDNPKRSLFLVCNIRNAGRVQS